MQHMNRPSHMPFYLAELKGNEDDHHLQASNQHPLRAESIGYRETNRLFLTISLLGFRQHRAMNSLTQMSP
jgi:hypothetical protein